MAQGGEVVGKKLLCDRIIAEKGRDTYREQRDRARKQSNE